MYRREHAIRGAFSFVAAAVLLYMSAEYADAFIRIRRPESLLLALIICPLAVMEAWKTGTRVERLLGLR